MFEITEVPFKGKGLVATLFISKGTRILAEAPMLTIKSRMAKGPNGALYAQFVLDEVTEQVAKLTEEQRTMFEKMNNVHPFENVAEKYVGIVRTVSYVMDSGSEDERVGVFPMAAYVNNNCSPNAHKNWNANIGRYTVHAVRDISPGDEITVFYLAKPHALRTRRALLWKGFQFICTCDACSLPQLLSDALDRQLEQIKELNMSIQAKIDNRADLVTPHRILLMLRDLVGLHKTASMPAVGLGLGRAYLDAAMVCLRNGDEARGHAFLQEVVAELITACGDDDAGLVRYRELVANPRLDPEFGMTCMWATAITEGDPYHNMRWLGQVEAFEEWLWARAVYTMPMAARDKFLPLSRLPAEGNVDYTFHSGNDHEQQDRVAHRHWAFAGQISHVVYDPVWLVYVRDVEDREVIFAVYAEVGHLINKSLYKTNTTLIVMYEEWLGFHPDFSHIHRVHVRRTKVSTMTKKKHACMHTKQREESCSS